MIRPTGDRIRETLFNWLMNDIHGARCLDLFAGSGALGFEALSRGAEWVTWVEKDPSIAKSIRDNAEKLEADKTRYELAISDAYSWIEKQTQSYDIVFLDPPFTDDRIQQLMLSVVESGLAKHYMYVETGAPVVPGSLPRDWQLSRQKNAGAVHYALCSVITG